MAEQYANSLANPTTKLAAGISSADLSLTVVSAAELPSTGNFRLRIDDEIIIVGARTGTTCSSLTRGAESTTAVEHAANASVRLVLTKAGFLAAVDELIHDTAETFTAAQTFSALLTATLGLTVSGDVLKIPNGSASAPGVTFGTDPDTGIYRVGANSLGISAGGVNQATINTVAVSLTNNLVVAKNLAVGVQKIGAAYTLVGTTPAELQIDTANATLLLNQTIWGYTTTPQYIITDPNGLLGAGTPLVITPWDDVVSEFNDINGGQAATGVWNGLGGPNGPGGVTMALATQYGKYSLTRNLVDTGSGATGGWTLGLLGVLL